MSPDRDAAPPAGEAHVVEARTHGRYRLLAPHGAPRGILVGFHGYLENAEIHLRELASIPGAADWALVAVDALHAFYARSTGAGTVVRGWMTRELREEAIRDNVEYVRTVLRQVRSRFGWELPVVVLGFSQGASMAWRAALLGGHEIAAAVALAGDIPPELGELAPESPFPPRALIARGDGDEWYDAAKLARDRELLSSRSTGLAELVFPGGHVWSDPFRDAVGELLGTVGESAAGGR